MGPRRSRKFKLSIVPYTMKPEDREFMMNQYRHIKELSSLAKYAGKDCKLLLQTEINSVREELNNSYAQKFWAVTIQLGPHKYREILPYYPKSQEVVELRDKLVKSLAKERKGSKKMNYSTREFNGMQYQMLDPERGKRVDGFTLAPRGTPATVTVEKKQLLPNFKGCGRVFDKPGTIVQILNGPEYANRIGRAKKPYDKSNYVGVELELIAKVDRETLNQAFIKAKLAGNVYVKHDGSIRPESNEHIAHEITLIAKQANINDVVNRVCAVLRDKKIDAYVNNSCGMHVHLDMRNRTPELCYKNLYYSLGILSRMVPPDRIDTDHGRRFCALNTSDNFNLPTRYYAINTQSYGSHRTIEIRLHSGTTNPTKINNWINILLAVIEKKDSIGVHVMTPEDMSKHFGIDAKLVEYIKVRTDKFKDRSLDTRKDHFADEISA